MKLEFNRVTDIIYSQDVHIKQIMRELAGTLQDLFAKPSMEKYGFLEFISEQFTHSIDIGRKGDDDYIKLDVLIGGDGEADICSSYLSTSGLIESKQTTQVIGVDPATAAANIIVKMAEADDGFRQDLSKALELNDQIFGVSSNGKKLTLENT